MEPYLSSRTNSCAGRYAVQPRYNMVQVKHIIDGSYVDITLTSHHTDLLIRREPPDIPIRSSALCLTDFALTLEPQKVDLFVRCLRVEIRSSNVAGHTDTYEEKIGRYRRRSIRVSPGVSNNICNTLRFPRGIHEAPRSLSAGSCAPYRTGKTCPA